MCYFLVPLQTWVFAMKYWESATNCSLTPERISPKVIRKIKWTGISVYTMAIVVMWIYLMSTWPGWDEKDEKKYWFDFTYPRI
jgi:hypothetical protein